MTNTSAPNRALTEASRYTIATTRSRDGALELRYSVYLPKGEAKQFVVFLNGRSEFLEKYTYVADDLDLPAHTGFLTWDHRGQGASGGTRATVDSYDSYADDAKLIIDLVVGNRPYVLMSHSMGSLISLYGALTGRIKPKAMVLSSPLLGLPNKPVPPVIGRPLAALLSVCGLGSVSSGVSALEATPFEHNDLTHDIGRYQAIVASKYRLPSPTFGWGHATFKALSTCFDPTKLATLTIPTLVLTAGEESVVNPDATRRWVQIAAAHAKAEVQISTFQGARHELLSEVPQHYKAAVAAMKQWFKGHLGGAEAK